MRFFSEPVKENGPSAPNRDGLLGSMAKGPAKVLKRCRTRCDPPGNQHPRRVTHCRFPSLFFFFSSTQTHNGRTRRSENNGDEGTEHEVNGAGTFSDDFRSWGSTH